MARCLTAAVAASCAVQRRSRPGQWHRMAWDGGCGHRWCRQRQDDTARPAGRCPSHAVWTMAAAALGVDPRAVARAQTTARQYRHRYPPGRSRFGSSACARPCRRDRRQCGHNAYSLGNHSLAGCRRMARRSVASVHHDRRSYLTALRRPRVAILRRLASPPCCCWVALRSSR